MTPINVVALSRIVTDKEKDAARDQITPGKHAIDIVVRVHGAMTVGDDFEQSPTARAVSLETVATALYFAGVTRERAVAALERAALGKATEADDKREVVVKAIVGDLKAMYASLPKEAKRGQVRATLIVNEVSEVERDSYVAEAESEITVTPQVVEASV